MKISSLKETKNWELLKLKKKTQWNGDRKDNKQSNSRQAIQFFSKRDPNNQKMYCNLMLLKYNSLQSLVKMMIKTRLIMDQVKMTMQLINRLITNKVKRVKHLMVLRPKVFQNGWKKLKQRKNSCRKNPGLGGRIKKWGIASLIF